MTIYKFESSRIQRHVRLGNIRFRHISTCESSTLYKVNPKDTVSMRSREIAYWLAGSPEATRHGGAAPQVNVRCSPCNGIRSAADSRRLHPCTTGERRADQTRPPCSTQAVVTRRWCRRPRDPGPAAEGVGVDIYLVQKVLTARSGHIRPSVVSAVTGTDRRIRRVWNPTATFSRSHHSRTMLGASNTNTNWILNKSAEILNGTEPRTL